MRSSYLAVLTVLTLSLVAVGVLGFSDDGDSTDTIDVSFMGVEPYGTLASGEDEHTFTRGQAYGWLPTPTITLSGWEFAGWYTKQGTDNPSTWGTHVTSSSTVITQQYILWAHFTRSVVAEYYVVYNYNGGFGNVGYKVVTATSTTQQGVPIGTYGTLTEAYKAGYRFTGWYSAPSGGTQITSELIVSSNVTIYAHYEQGGYTVTLDANGGTVSPSSLTVYNGDTFHDLPTPTKDGYNFNGWKYNTVNVSKESTIWLTGNITLTASWSVAIVDTVYWSNSTVTQELYNSVVEVGFKWQPSNNKMHTMSIEIYKPVVNDDGTVRWLNTHAQLVIEVSYPSVTINMGTARTDVPGIDVVLSAQEYTSGMWSAFSITIDLEQGAIYFTPFYDFISFSDYKSYDRVLIWNMPSYFSGSAIKNIRHNESNTGTNHPLFSVLDTKVFLNTYGVVMVNPEINVYSYFPNFTSARLSIHSVAVFGKSMDLNGYGFTVTDGKTSIWLVKDSSGNYVIGSSTTQGAIKKTVNFTNFNITWQDGVCKLTFEDDRLTILLGSYVSGDWSVSFSGVWYFNASLYEPTTGKELRLAGDWDTLPNLDANAMILLFVGILVLLGIIARIKLNAKWLDLVVMAGAVVIAYMLLR